MNRERTAAAAAVMLAFAEGKPVEWRNNSRDWHPLHPVDQPIWNWQAHEYRVKPQALKSRRYLRRGRGFSEAGRHIALINEGLGDPSHVERDITFVRWIDPHWVETEL